jgi:hypothetical protein
LPPTKQMQVKVINGLTAILAVVDYDTVSLSKMFFPGNLGGCPHEVAKESTLMRVGFTEGGDVLARHDEDVNRRFGINVGKGVGEFVLMNGCGWNLAFNNLAEDATHGEDSVHRTATHSESLKPEPRRMGRDEK